MKRPSFRFSGTQSHLMFKNLTRFAVALTVTSAIVGFEQQPVKAQGYKYSIAILPTLGGPASYGYGINNNGQVTGWSDISFASNNVRHSFVWMPGKGVIDTGAVTNPVPYSINDNGQATGTAYVNVGTNGNNVYTNRAYLWQAGTLVTLGTLSQAQASQSLGSAINKIGQITGNADTDITLPNGSKITKPRAFIWQNGAMQTLGALTQDRSSYGSAINDNGMVAGSSDLPNALHACVWANGTLQDLNAPYVTPANPGYGQANGINNAGQVVGRLNPSPGTGGSFLWSAATGLQFLPLPPSQMPWEAKDINNNGQVVGGSCIWDATNGTRDLNALIPPGIAQITYAESINDKGQITGMCINFADKGLARAFVLTPISSTSSSAATSSIKGS